jgi:hypothetical protein
MMSEPEAHYSPNGMLCSHDACPHFKKPNDHIAICEVTGETIWLGHPDNEETFEDGGETCRPYAQDVKTEARKKFPRYDNRQTTFRGRMVKMKVGDVDRKRMLEALGADPTEPMSFILQEIDPGDLFELHLVGFDGTDKRVILNLPVVRRY